MQGSAWYMVHVQMKGGKKTKRKGLCNGRRGESIGWSMVGIVGRKDVCVDREEGNDKVGY